MDAVLQLGLDLIYVLQAAGGPALNLIFEIITTLGDEEFYLLLLTLVLWTLDFSFGLRLGIAFLFSSLINTGLKDLWMQPRPFDLDPSVKLSEAEGYGLPSGHSQSALVAWGIMATRVRKPWFWGLALLLIALIGFSRIYLGVHFPTDVIVGWMLGLVILMAFYRWADLLADWLRGLGLVAQILLALAIPMLLYALHPVKDSASAMAALAGVGVGLAIHFRHVDFDANGRIWQRTLRLLLGLVVVVGLYLGLRMVFPGEGEPLYLLFRLLRYGLVGLWVTLGAPWVFSLVGLSGSKEPPA